MQEDANFFKKIDKINGLIGDYQELNHLLNLNWHHFTTFKFLNPETHDTFEVDLRTENKMFMRKMIHSIITAKVCELEEVIKKTIK